MQRLSGLKASQWHSLRFDLKASEALKPRFPLPQLLSSCFWAWCMIVYASLLEIRPRLWLTTKRLAVKLEYDVCGVKSVWKFLISFPWCMCGKYKSSIIPNSAGVLEYSLWRSFAMLGTLTSTKTRLIYIDTIYRYIWCGFFYYYAFYPGLHVFIFNSSVTFKHL